MRRLAVLAALLALMASTAAASPSVPKLSLGIAGDPGRFQAQTGQQSAIRSFFLGWQQGQTWGTRFPRMLQLMGPIPMFHIGTKGRNRKEAITPRKVANGLGDGYLIAL